MGRASKINEPLISIIVPIYNGEKYINSCIDKLLKIKAPKEIISVNDCSTDDSLNLLKKYKNKIKLIDLKENHGVSYARNLGIKKAKGKYIGFVDIDDKFDDKMFDKMLDKIEKSKTNLCVCNYDEFEENTDNITNSKYNYSFDTLNGNLALKEYLIDNISPAIWDKIYCYDTIKDIKFNENLAIGEDILFCLEAFTKCESVSFINDRFYHYLQQPNSAMHKISPKLLQFKQIPNELSENEEKYLKENFEEEFEYFELEMYTRGIHSLSSLYNKENKKQVKDYLKKYYNKNVFKKILKNKYTAKSIKLEIFILKNFGINIHLLLMPIYKFARKKLR